MQQLEYNITGQYGGKLVPESQWKSFVKSGNVHKSSATACAQGFSKG